MKRLVPLALSCLLAAAPPADDLVAEVNGHRLTERDLAAFLALRGAPDDVSPTFRREAVRQLVDRELVRQFLERRKTSADPAQLEATVNAAKARLAALAKSKDPNAVLASLGADEARLRSELAVSIAWRHHARRTVADSRIRAHFETHRRRLDGTRLRVSQIFRKYEPDESATSAPKTTARLTSVRQQIASGKTTFAAAAKAHSQAPTAAEGGDVGWIGPRGDLPATVSRAAYALEPGQVSEPVLSPFGVHLVTVTETEPGELSLEDARPAILVELSQALWDETVAAERKTAKIDMKE